MEFDCYFLCGIGTFPTCEICNTGYAMMRETRKYNMTQRKIIWAMLEAHLRQQQRERTHKEMIKMRCCETDAHGQPVAAFIYHDAMTEHRGNTPHLFMHGERWHPQGPTISNRVFAVEIVCLKRREFRR